MSGTSVSAMTAVVMIAVAALAWLVASGTARRLSPARGATLLLLRFVWVGLALLLALGLRLPDVPELRPMVAVFENGAASGPASWDDELRSLRIRLGETDASSATRRGTPPGTRPGTPRGRPALPGPRTLTAALDEFERVEPPPDGYVALGSPNPIDRQAAPRPLYVLDALSRADDRLHLVDIEIPRQAVQGVGFSVGAMLRGGADCAGETWTVRLIGPAGTTEGEAKVRCEPRVLADAWIAAAPTSPGSWNYRLEWSPAEATDRSLFRDFKMDARASAARALLIEALPGWEATFLRRTLVELEGIEVTPLTRLSQGRQGSQGSGGSPGLMLRGLEAPVSDVGLGLESVTADDFELLILRLGEEELADTDAAWIHRFVSVRGGGLILLGGMPAALSDLAPLGQGGTAPAATGPVELAEGAGTHPIVEELAGVLAGLPALQMEMSPPAVVPAATQVLATSASQPFLAVRRFGGGRVLQVAGPETYRWKLRGGEAAAAHSSLWRQAASWLIGRARPRRQLQLSRPWTVPGDRVPVVVAMHDARFQPLTEPVRLQGTAAAGTTLLPIPFQAGRFRGTIAATEGSHSIGLAGNQGSAGETSWIVAKPLSAAENSTVALAGLASRSGGRILDPGPAPPEIIRAEGMPASVRRRTAREVGWIPAILLLAAMLEWGARRRWGCEG